MTARLNDLEGERMRAVEVEPRLVLRVARGRRGIELAVVEEAQLLDACAEGGASDVPRVLQAVDVAEFLSVISGDGQLLDALLGKDELDDDLRVEMKVI